jgi:hypothetical protein
LQLFLLLFGLAVGAYVMYYLPLIAKDLHKSTKQNEVIIKLLEKKIVRDEER